MIKLSLLTLFPSLLEPFSKEALIGKAVQRGLIAVEIVNLRNFSGNKHHKVDNTPYGGGAGMVIRVDVVERALLSLDLPDEVILLTPAGKAFTQEVAEELAQNKHSSVKHIAILCGRYEGFDARVESLVTREISIGDFVMMGGEAAAACLLEAVARLVPDVIGDASSHAADSFSSGILDYPEYTKPQHWQDKSVPEVLLSGNHDSISRWRRQAAIQRTLNRRPDLLLSANLSYHDTETLIHLGVAQTQLLEWQAPDPPKTRRKKLSTKSTQ